MGKGRRNKRRRKEKKFIRRLKMADWKPKPQEEVNGKRDREGAGVSSSKVQT